MKNKAVIFILLLSQVVVGFLIANYFGHSYRYNTHIKHSYADLRYTPNQNIELPQQDHVNYDAMLEKPRATPAFPEWKPGPLGSSKANIAQKLEPTLKTGDILFRSSDARAANGIRFSRLVERATNSDFSHASIILKANKKTYVVEVDDEGVHLFLFADWLDTPADADFAVYRLHNLGEAMIANLKREIDRILIEKPAYDFTFDDPDKLYCVESVAEIYLRCGIKLCEPRSVREVLSPLTFALFAPVNRRMKRELGQGLPEDEPMWFVGNENHGLMSSPYLEQIYRHKYST